MPERTPRFISRRLRGWGAILLGAVIPLAAGCDKLQIPQVGQQQAAPVVPASVPAQPSEPTAKPATQEPVAPAAKADPKEIVAAFMERASKPGGVGDADIIAVTDLTEGLDVVTELKLSGANITDVGVARLPKFPNLTVLDLTSSRVTTDGTAVLKELPELTKLGLGQTLIDDRALDNIKDLKKLTELTIPKTTISDIGLAKLGVLNDLEVLDISEAGGIKGYFFENLKNNHKLRVLRAHHTFLLGETMKFLSKCPIEELNLENSRMDDQGMMTIARMGKLKNLNLNHCSITDFSVKHMVPMIHLESATFRNNGGISNLLFAKLTRSKKLKYLDVSGTRINAADVAKLAKMIPECNITN